MLCPNLILSSLLTWLLFPLTVSAQSCVHCVLICLVPCMRTCLLHLGLLSPVMCILHLKIINLDLLIYVSSCTSFCSVHFCDVSNFGACRIRDGLPFSPGCSGGVNQNNTMHLLLSTAFLAALDYLNSSLLQFTLFSKFFVPLLDNFTWGHIIHWMKFQSFCPKP